MDLFYVVIGHNYESFTFQQYIGHLDIFITVCTLALPKPNITDGIISIGFSTIS